MRAGEFVTLKGIMHAGQYEHPAVVTRVHNSIVPIGTAHSLVDVVTSGESGTFTHGSVRVYATRLAAEHYLRAEAARLTAGNESARAPAACFLR